MEEGKKKCKGCSDVKLLSEFVKSMQYKDRRTPKCKVCLLKRSKELAEGKRLSGVKYRKVKQISEDDRAFYELGILKGQEGINDVKKALGVMEKANRALLEVIKDADQRNHNSQFRG